MASKIFLGALLSAAAFAAPLEERQNCATVWGQCGGNGWTGPTCCAAGSVCSVGNPWYSQCLPGTAPPAASSTTTSRPPSSSAAPPSSTVVPGSSTRPTSVVVPTTSAGATTTSSGPAPTGGATYSGNPFVGVNQWANAYYRSEILSLAVPSLTGPLATAAAKVADVPTFQWMDTRAKVPLVDTALGEIRAANARGGNNAGIFVVYNLPDRDCAAAASNGELAIADDGVNKYKAYIDSIRAVLLKYSDVRTILVIEPDSLANMCANAAAAYQECTVYALKQLDLPNVAQYLDAGHAGWLGWPANIEKAADVFAKVYNDAGKPRSVRGFATNVSNYNGLRLSTAPSYTSPNPNFDEERYINAFAPLLRSRGFDAKFIVDQGRSGKQPTGQVEWGHWQFTNSNSCNARDTGFGARPSTNTGNALIDAIVWIKPGGEADGTSDSSAPRFDTFCRSASSVIPAPEAGTWFQTYFEMLVRNANPSFL